MKSSVKLFLVVVLLEIMVVTFFLRRELKAKISLNGIACNYSSTDVWLAVTEARSRRQTAYLLSPNHCTNFSTQDAEAIWGKDCTQDPCTYQAWKIGAGRFTIEDHGGKGSSSILRIKGWGIESRWHVTREWPKPDLSAISYSLVH